ncbi:MAG TPA: ABC transporter permease [Terriglobales bacterium]|jgi:putative ABC transport system permease protein|nr:ABC transporter permease [Terriglobales bacterium]
METLLQDIRYGLRMLLKSPGFTAMAVITLALGIGGNTAMFSIVHSVLLKPLPFPNSERLISVNETDSRRPGLPDTFSYPDFFDYRAQNRTFEGMATYRDASFNLTGVGQPQHLDGQVVSSDFFSVLGVKPALGRGFRREEEQAGRWVVVVSHQLWQSKFGSDPNIVGRTITLDNRSYTVIGVAPASFEFPVEYPAPQLWGSMARDADPGGGTPATAPENRGAHFLSVIGRLKPGVTLAQAQTETDLIARRLAHQYPDSNTRRAVTVLIPQLQRMVGNVRPALLVLLAAVGFVLLIACANVANLLLAQASKRQREITLRAALGAPRRRLVRQLLTESLLLGVAGGGLGLGLASWILVAIVHFESGNIPRLDHEGLNLVVLAFTALVSIAASLLFGLAPAWQTARTDLAETLREGGRGAAGAAHSNRLRSGLVIAETAIGVVLLVGAGLLLRSFQQLIRVDPHFNPHYLLALDVNLPSSRYNDQQTVLFYDQLLAKLRALPGVDAASAAWPLPFSGNDATISFEIQGRPSPPGQHPFAALAVVSPGYFHTLGIALLRGREFNLRDDAKSPPVVIVSQNFARQYFSNQNPIGQHMRPGIGDEKAPMREIVGVVADIKHDSLSDDFDPRYYLPYSQGMFGPQPSIVLRSAGNPATQLDAVSSAIHGMDKELAVFNVHTMDEMMSNSANQPRFNAFLFSLFAAVALLLTAIGLYGVMAYSVVQKTHEIGIRMALGADPSDLLRMVLQRAVVLVGAGLGVGIAIGLGVTRFLASMLFAVHPLDWPTYAAVAAVLMGVGLLAGYVPARRASRVDPMVALRYE